MRAHGVCVLSEVHESYSRALALAWCNIPETSVIIIYPEASSPITISPPRPASMNKRYQVFVSSTYADLKEERSRVIQTLMEMDCIPSGMELFPALDEEQFEFIKKVIDDCDYYLLIIGGRYGTITPEGVSYTEKEYDYAISKGLRVIALLHKEPGNIPVGKTDQDPKLAKRLRAFRKKVENGRLVKYWTSADELPGIVSLSMLKTIKMYPATGWIRGDAAASADVLEEINELRKANAALRAASSPSLAAPLKNVAGLKAPVTVTGTWRGHTDDRAYSWQTNTTFGSVFSGIGPHLFGSPCDSIVKDALAEQFRDREQSSFTFWYIDDACYNLIKIQFQALGLVVLESGQGQRGVTEACWCLTSAGTQTLFELIAVRSES